MKEYPCFPKLHSEGFQLRSSCEPKGVTLMVSFHAMEYIDYLSQALIECVDYLPLGPTHGVC